MRKGIVIVSSARRAPAPDTTTVRVPASGIAAGTAGAAMVVDEGAAAGAS